MGAEGLHCMHAWILARLRCLLCQLVTAQCKSMHHHMQYHGRPAQPQANKARQDGASKQTKQNKQAGKQASSQACIWPSLS